MEIVTAIVSKVGEYLVEPSINQARYLFRFNKIVEDLLEAERNLKSKQGDVEKEIVAAERNDERIKATVQDWLSDSRKIMGEVETLKGKIEVNKTCLNGWCPNWVSRHQLGRKATKTSIRLKEITDKGQFDGVGHRALLSGEPSAPKDPAPLSGEPSAPKDFEFCRSTKVAFDEIMKALKNDGIHMVILYGMGGVGKTTLAREVRKTVEEKGIFKEVVMATVSQTPNFRNIQGQLADFLGLTFTEETEEGRAQRLSSRLSKSNNSLIILDDVWEEFNFEEKIGVPLSKGCKMLLTSRYRNVCTYREYQLLIPLNVLEEDEGVTLLKRQAGIDDDSVSLNTLATEIAKECGGLPLALVTTGRYLRGKKGIEIWEEVCEKLKKSKLEDLCLVNSTERGVYASLKLSYDYLRGEKIRLCFLMCSLFPEDFEIPLEDLVRIGVGLDLYEGVSSIEEARRDLRLIVEELKALGLLLDAYEKEFVRMHDIVRDVCLWITSKGENIFMSKIRMDLTQLTREKGWKQYTAISLLENKLEELSVRLVCPKLKILLLGGEKQWLYNYDKSKLLKVSDECFEEMKALEVVSLRYADLSLKSLQFLTNLKTLELFDCDLRDISFLAKLNKLEILSFRGSCFDELPIELSGLKELRMLDLRGRSELRRIPSNLIRSFSQLEELYMEEDIFEEREVEEKSIETGNARLSEVNYLPCLAVLYLKINSKCLPKDFAFSKFSRYKIYVNRTYSYSESSKALIIGDIDATLLTALFKALYHSVEHLSLEGVTGCQNILPSIDQKGLKKLNALEVRDCEDLKCMIDASQVVEENAKLHPSLAKLELRELPELQCIWKGPMSIHIVNFQSLTDVYVRECKSLAYLFTLSIARSLGQLKSLSVRDCESLEFLIKIEKGDNGRGEKMLSKLEDLQIERCKRLAYLFTLSIARSLGQLKSLRVENCESLEFLIKTEEGDNSRGEKMLSELEDLRIKGCKRLAYLFTLSIARSLGQLKSLRVENCESLEFLIKTEEGDNGRGEKMLSELEDLRIKGCKRLAYLFTLSIARSLGQLKSLRVENCESLEFLIKTEEGDNGRGEKMLSKLEDLRIKGCKRLAYLFTLSIARSLGQLKSLRVKDCESLEFLLKIEEGDNGRGEKMLSKLEDFQIENCQRLEYVFPVFVAAGLIQLKNLEIEDAAELKQVFHGKEENEIAEEGKDIKLPNLNKLKLYYLEKLTRFFPENNHSTLPALEEFSVIECPNLTIKEGVLDEFQNLQVIEMINCSSQLCDGVLFRLRCGFFKKIKELSMEDCGVLEHELSFSNLKNLTSLTITHFNKLKHIFSPTVARNHMLQLKGLFIRECAELEQIIDVKDGEEVGANLLQTLSWIKVEKCHKLKNLFPISIARDFQQLATLRVLDNSELEQIIDVKDGEEVGANLLQTLSDITVGKCHKLKNLFPISIARGFQQLKYLQVTDNSELEEIFGDNDVIDEKEIQLPRLQIIYLGDLPRLTNFCHVDYHFIFPTPPLRQLEVKRCPQISTRFSWDEKNKSVHAEAKAPKIGSEDESHEGTSTDLSCYHNFGKLPRVKFINQVLNCYNLVDLISTSAATINSTLSFTSSVLLFCCYNLFNIYCFVLLLLQILYYASSTTAVTCSLPSLITCPFKY
ncbi:hypothetical protein Patl1_33132 [Pistacia atlantica]|uniref:Uncharacterized protein n=1 Tax=Pistacia atlantica TaxID=434234 RepID=A0ACC1AN63_9ROSI|nr:hypothetical protein Patl1_33132 [Pistacia atlantica]